MNNAGGFIKFCRSTESKELLRDPLAFCLLGVIAFRARWHQSGFSFDGLEPGEAFIGDYENYGMTRAEYRTRIARLVKWRRITVRTTNWGTIAKLISTEVFDINIERNERVTNHGSTQNSPSNPPPDSGGKNGSKQPPAEPSNNQQTTSGQPLTKNDKKQRKKETIAEPSADKWADELEKFKADNRAAGLVRF